VAKPKQKSDSLEQDIKRYLLGQSAGSAETSFEESVMSDDEYFREVDELVEVVRNDLVEDYLSGELSEEDRGSFERRMLSSPEVHAQIPLSKALLALGERGSKRREHRMSWNERLGLWIQPVWRPAPALATIMGLALVSGGVWSTSQIVHLEVQLDQAASEQATLTATQASLRAELDKERRQRIRLSGELEATSSRLLGLEQTVRSLQQKGGAATTSFILKPGLQRSGGEIARVAISPDLRLVELRLDVGLDEYQSYRATLHDSSDSELLMQGRLPAVAAGETVHVVLELPIGILRVDDYQIRLRGVTRNQQLKMIDSYRFRVVLR
jgi:hypothetical protein